MTNLLSAWRMATQGQTTKLGNAIPMLDKDGEIVPVKLDSIEAIQKLAGWQPVKLAEGWRRFEASVGMEEKWQKAKQRIRSKYMRATRKGNDKELRRLENAIESFNEKKPDFIAPIDGSYLVEGLTLHPSAREILKMREIE